MTKDAERGALLVVSSPSGAGKTTLCRRLIAEFEHQLSFSVSYTTRPRRQIEVDGVDYHFVNEATFDEMIASGQFAEWAEVHGHRYGTAKKTISDNIDRGRDVLFDIDWQGGARLKAMYGEESVMVFVLPPSMGELERRLRNRATESEQVLARRLAKAKEELGHWGEYNYLVTNDDLDQAYGELRAIYVAAHCTVRRRSPRALALLDEVRSD